MCTSNSWKTSTPTARWRHSTYTKNATRWTSYRLSCLWQHIATKNLRDIMQSVYRQHHSTKTALVKVRHDIVHILVSGRCAMLLLLDSSATSDTINIDKLINNLVSRVNIDGVARDWFRFNLTGRYQCVTIDSSSSNTIPVCHGLPPGWSTSTGDVQSIYGIYHWHLNKTSCAFPSIRWWHPALCYI